MAVVAIGRHNTSVTKFVLLGFSDNPQMKVFLFVFFLGIYLLALLWNLTLIALIRMDPHLHTPTYFFLRNLSFIDICYVSSTTPKMLSVLITEQKTISLLGCAMQYFVFCGLGLTECFLLAAMAYDRYAAICNPLLYTALISHTLCVKMVAGAYAVVIPMMNPVIYSLRNKEIRNAMRKAMERDRMVIPGHPFF